MMRRAGLSKRGEHIGFIDHLRKPSLPKFIDFSEKLQPAMAPHPLIIMVNLENKKLHTNEDGIVFSWKCNFIYRWFLSWLFQFR